ncbi:MAG: hypothetical protein ACMG57_01610 [Candidatus Dojkabacteria bacterium]
MDNQPETEALSLIAQVNSMVVNAGIEPNIDKSELASLQSKARGFDELIKRHHDAIINENKRFRDSVVSLVNDINQTHSRAQQTPASN